MIWYFKCFKNLNDIIHIKDVNLIINTTIAWIISVLFAYITNKKWVFESDKKGKNAILKEMGAFFSCRVATGIMDVIIVYVFVSALHFPEIPVKLLSNVLVIILNYVGSKLVIFKDR